MTKHILFQWKKKTTYGYLVNYPSRDGCVYKYRLFTCASLGVAFFSAFLLLLFLKLIMFTSFPLFDISVFNQRFGRMSGHKVASFRELCEPSPRPCPAPPCSRLKRQTCAASIVPYTTPPAPTFQVCLLDCLSVKQGQQYLCHGTGEGGADQTTCGGHQHTVGALS